MYGESNYGSTEYGSISVTSVAHTLSLTDTATATEIFNKSPAKFLIDQGTLTEVFIHIRNAFKLFLETTNLSELFKKASTRIVSDIGTLSDTLRSSYGRFISFIDSFLGLVDIDIETQQSKGLEFIDGTILSETIKRDSTRNFLDISTLSDIFSKIQNRFRTFIDSFTGLIDSFIFGRNKTKNVTDQISPTDSINRSHTRIFSDIGNLSDLLSRTMGKNRLLTDNLNLSDLMTRSIVKMLVDITSLVDKIKKYLNGNIVINYLYNLKNTLFSNKYTSKGTSFTDKYSGKNTTYSNKYNKKETNY